MADTLLSLRTAFVTLLARRAEASTDHDLVAAVGISAWRIPKRFVPWAEIEAACAARSAPRCDVRGRVPIWALDLMLAARFGGGRRMATRGAKGRLVRLIRVGAALRRWNGGLRLEELAAVLREDEARLARLLAWAEREGALRNEGERGWFLVNE
jgi:hypothetical protein